MPDTIRKSVECSDCGYVFHREKAGKHPGEDNPCPNCSSLKRHIHLSIKETFGLSDYIGIKVNKLSKHRGKRSLKKVTELVKSTLSGGKL